MLNLRCIKIRTSYIFQNKILSSNNIRWSLLLNKIISDKTKHSKTIIFYFLQHLSTYGTAKSTVIVSKQSERLIDRTVLSKRMIAREIGSQIKTASISMDYKNDQLQCQITLNNK